MLIWVALAGVTALVAGIGAGAWYDRRRGAGAASERDRLMGTLAASTDGVVVTDRSGRVVVRNPVAQRYDGARGADALVEEALDALLDRARHGPEAEQELELFGPPRRTLHLRAVPLRGAKGIVGAAAFVQDISEARRVERVRRDFVANVSHELKTPIGALALLAETMAADDDPAIQRQLAERLVREADRLGRIVDDLLDLSLIEALDAPHREPAPVKELIAEARDRVRGGAEAGRIPLAIADVPEDLVVECDAAQVVSAIANLLDNAVKYSEPGQPVELAARAEPGRLTVAVSDHGIGIPARDVERIFERFYRVDRARSRATGGTGLGLSIVRHVAQAHGGEVTVESLEGEGSTFRLVLPLADRDEDPARPLGDGGPS